MWLFRSFFASLIRESSREIVSTVDRLYWSWYLARESFFPWSDELRNPTYKNEAPAEGLWLKLKLSDVIQWRRKHMSPPGSQEGL